MHVIVLQAGFWDGSQVSPRSSSTTPFPQKNWQLGSQSVPPSHFSLPSTTPLPQIGPPELDESSGDDVLVSSDALADELDVVSGFIVLAIEKVSEIPPSAPDVDPSAVDEAEVTELVLVDATMPVVLLEADSPCSPVMCIIRQATLGARARSRVIRGYNGMGFWNPGQKLTSMREDKGLD